MFAAAPNASAADDDESLLEGPLLQISSVLALVSLSACTISSICFLCRLRKRDIIPLYKTPPWTERLGALFGATACLSLSGLLGMLSWWAIDQSDPITLEHLVTAVSIDCSGLRGCWHDATTMGLFFGAFGASFLCCVCCACVGCVASSHTVVSTDFQSHQRFEQPVKIKVNAQHAHAARATQHARTLTDTSYQHAGRYRTGQRDQRRPEDR